MRRAMAIRGSCLPRSPGGEPIAPLIPDQAGNDARARSVGSYSTVTSHRERRIRCDRRALRSVPFTPDKVKTALARLQLQRDWDITAVAAISRRGCADEHSVRSPMPLCRRPHGRVVVFLPVDWLREGAGSGGQGRLARARPRDFLPLALSCRLEVATFGLDGRECTTVEIVDVTPHLQLAGVVDKGRLIGQVDPDRGRQNLQVLLRAAVHAPDLLRGPVLVRPRNLEENLGVFGRILNPHAAMAVGAH